MGIIRYDDIEQQIRAHNRAIIRQEGMVEEAAGLALQDLLERMSNSAGRALTASSLPVSFGTGELFTLGQVRGWWADAVDEHLTSSLLESWNAGYRATSDGVMLQGSFDSAGGYVANVADRLSVTQTPLIPDQAFNIVRESLLDEMSRGSTTDAISKRIASDLNWVGPDRADLERRLSVVNQQLEDVLDGYGPPGSSARNTARLNDPQVRSLQKRNSGIVRQLDRDESVWRTRARTISRTETTGAWNAGALDAAQREGQAVKVWIALGDEFVRESHLDAAGQCVPVEGEFQVGGSNMTAPGVGGPADEVINCRCSMLFADSCEVANRMVEPAAERWDEMRGQSQQMPIESISPPAESFRTIATSQEEADRWGLPAWGPNAARLSDPQEQALRAYQGSSHGPINSALRRNAVDELGQIEQGMIRSIDEVLSTANTVPDDILVFRGVSGKFADEIKSGLNEWTDNGFVSTSLDRAVTREFGEVVMEIRVKKGTRAFYMNANEKGRAVMVEEAELLLPRGQRFRVVERRESKVILEIVGTDATPVL